MMPVVISTVASAGRPRAIPPSRAKLTRRRPPLDPAREQEERRRDQPVVDHLQHRAVQPEVVDREEAERDQPHLREAASRRSRRAGRARGRRAASRRRARSRPATRIGVRKSYAGPGNFGIAIRRKPYAAAFETTPDSTAATSGEASR